MITCTDSPAEQLFRQLFGNAPTEVSMITNFLNLLLDAWGGVSAGSSGYHIPPGTLPFGS